LKSNRINRKSDYSKIKRRLYSYVLIALAAAVAFVVLLHRFIRQQGVVGDWIVNFLKERFRFDHQDAMIVYQYTIRNNMEILIFIAIAVCFLFLCRFIFPNIMRYCDEVNAGIE
jgi:two-component system sensor histidine kinase VanS